MAFLSFSYASYLGGFSGIKKKHHGNLIFADQTVGIGTLRPKAMWVKIDQIRSIEVSGGQVAKNKIGAEVAFGVLGGLGAKGAKDQTTVVVRMESGETGYFEIDRVAPTAVLAKLTPWMREHGIPTYDEARHAELLSAAGAPSAAPLSVADEISKLAELRSSGAITDGEFAAQKAKLLG